MTGEDIFNDQRAHGRSLEAAKMVRRSPIENSRKNIWSVLDENDIAWKEGRECGRVTENLFAIIVAFFFRETYEIVQGEKKEQLFSI